MEKLVEARLTVWRDDLGSGYHATLTVDCQAGSREEAITRLYEGIKDQIEQLESEVNHG